MFGRSHQHNDLEARLKMLESVVYRVFLGLVAGGFVVIAALIGFIGVLLAR